jgi:nucleotide-binding universal stress UspA family protein
MKLIVVGYDGSEAAERALGRAAEVAEAFSARLLVVSVGGSTYAATPTAMADFATAPVLGPVAPGGTVPPPEATTAAPEPDELARRQLEQARTALAGRSIDVDYVVELGDPAERLLDLADARDADLIVVGSREHGLLERLLSRPVDESVARRSERDVLLVH